MAFSWDRDIHMLTIVSYSGHDEKARTMGGLITDDTVVLRAIEEDQLHLGPLTNAIADVIR